MTWFRRALLFVTIIYLSICTLTFFAQRRMIYFPPAIYHAPQEGMSEVTALDGTIGWHSPAEMGRPTIMVFHGNASSIDSNMHIFRDLRANGYGVWSVGYPGYPGNLGKATQKTLTASAMSQYDSLRQMGVDKIIFYGTSLGSGVASQLSAARPPELLILDAPFNSMSDMAHRQMPILPTRILLKDKWKSYQALTDLDAPLIWIHGTTDSVVPLHQGQKLYDQYTGPKSAHIIQGAHHTNTWLLGGREIVLSTLANY